VTWSFATGRGRDGERGKRGKIKQGETRVSRRVNGAMGRKKACHKEIPSHHLWIGENESEGNLIWCQWGEKRKETAEKKTVKALLARVRLEKRDKREGGEGELRGGSPEG